MDRAEEWVKERKLTPQPDGNPGSCLSATRSDGRGCLQNVAGNTWIHAKRIELVKKYDLAGVAAWRRGFEQAEIWYDHRRRIEPKRNKNREGRDVSSCLGFLQFTGTSLPSRLSGCPQNMQASSFPSIFVTFPQDGHSTCGAEVEIIPEIINSTVATIVMNKSNEQQMKHKEIIFLQPMTPEITGKKPYTRIHEQDGNPMFQFAQLRIRLILLMRSIFSLVIPPVMAISQPLGCGRYFQSISIAIQYSIEAFIC